ncbi:MAG: hypothetical protein Q8P04_00205 [bacterium]|nr:hypothetical protein [bacterium]
MLKKLVHRVLCKLGYHKFIRAEEKTKQEKPWMKSFTNAVCIHCETEWWINWLPLKREEWDEACDRLGFPGYKRYWREEGV